MARGGRGFSIRASEIGTPAVTFDTPAPDPGLGTAQAEADVIPPAQRRHRPDHLLVVAPPAVEEREQGVRVVRLVPLGNERRLHERTRPGMGRLDR